MNVFVHPQALCESTQIGEGTRVWAFAHVLPGAQIGRDCNICDQVFIENDVVVGDRVTIKCGVQLWDGARIGNDVFIGPNATFTNDPFPRSKVWPERFTPIHIEDKVSIGANATLLPGITIGRNAMIGAGAVVTRAVPPNAIVVGNPARIIGYVDTAQTRAADAAIAAIPAQPGIHALDVGAVSVHRLARVVDMRGSLSVGEFERTIPFAPKRYFLVFDVPGREVRGEHAHRECHQFLICVRGSLHVLVDDGHRRAEVRLDSADVGIHLPPMTWGTQYRYSEDAVLLVFASHHYDPNEYIRDYSTYLAEKRAHP